MAFEEDWATAKIWLMRYSVSRWRLAVNGRSLVFIEPREHITKPLSSQGVYSEVDSSFSPLYFVVGACNIQC